MSIAALSSDICFAADDFQWWNSANIVADLSEKWTFTFEEQLRMGNDAGTLIRHHSDFGAVYHGLADWLDLGINYRSIETKTFDGDWNHRDRIHANFTFLGKIFGRGISNRLRFEYDTGQRIKDFGTFRNKITINPPFEFHPHREIFKSYTIKPYWAYELFYSTLNDKIARHRYTAGLSYKLSENWSSKIYYMYEENTSSKARDLNILGLQIKFIF
jgi:hypothetical protein